MDGWVLWVGREEAGCFGEHVDFFGGGVVGLVLANVFCGGY